MKAQTLRDHSIYFTVQVFSLRRRNWPSQLFVRAHWGQLCKGFFLRGDFVVVCITIGLSYVLCRERQVYVLDGRGLQRHADAVAFFSNVGGGFAAATAASAAAAAAAAMASAAASTAVAFLRTRFHPLPTQRRGGWMKQLGCKVVRKFVVLI